MYRLLTICLAAAVIALGCAQDTREPAPGPNHPANPHAATAPASPKMSATLNEGDIPQIDAVPGAVQSPTGADDKVAEAYTCPHHPKVIEAEPGTCPYCGMTLVPTASRQTSPVRAAPMPKNEGTK